MIIFWFRNFKIFMSISNKKFEFLTEISDFEWNRTFYFQMPQFSVKFLNGEFSTMKNFDQKLLKKYSSGNPRSKMLKKFINKCKITKIGVVRKKSYNLLQIDYLTDYACRRFYHVDLVSITAGDFQDYTAWYQGQTNMYTVHIILPLVHHTCL